MLFHSHVSHAFLPHQALVEGTSKAGCQATRQKGRRELLGVCSTSFPCNMGDALHRACGFLWWSVWPWGKEHNETQRLAQHQKALPGFGRSVSSVHEKQPAKLNGMVAAPSVIMLMRQGAVPATHWHGLHHEPVPGPCGAAASCPFPSAAREGGIAWESSIPPSFPPSPCNELTGWVAIWPYRFLLGYLRIFMRGHVETLWISNIFIRCI